MGKPKIKAVNTIEELLELLPQAFKAEENTGFSVRVSLLAEPELRLEVANNKWFLKILPRLHASRKLLDSFKQEKGSFVVLCPHIADPLAEDLRKLGINHIDLNGRLFVQTSGFGLIREPKNIRYRSWSSEPDLFSLKLSRVVRSFLSHPGRAWTQESLTDHTNVSRGLISRALAALENEDYVKKNEQASRHSPARYQLSNFDRLLDAWKAADSWSKRIKVQQYSLLAGDVFEIARSAQNVLGPENIVFTQWFAAWLRRPHTTPPLVSAYLKKQRLPEIPLGRKVDAGGNLWLITPADEGVFFETQETQGFQLTCDVQIYLDLLQVGLRGEEAAEELRKGPEFKGPAEESS